MSNDDWTISHNLSESKQMTMNNQLFRGRVTNVPDNKSNSVRVFISSTFTVTAKEIYQALNNNKNQPQRIVAFFREIEDIDHFDSKLKVKFSDTNDEHGELVLTDLKTFIETELGPNNIFTYRIKWTDESSRMKYLADFKDDFYNAIKNQIDYHMKQTRTKDSLYDEVVEHAIQCRMLNERYFPRDNILAQASTWFPKSNSVSIILRFLGTTPLSSDIRQPLISMMKQICAIYDIEPSSISESTKIEELKKTFEQILTRIPTDETLVLLFDSIDQLQIENYDCSKWLPISYPQNIKCILSTIPMISDERKDPPEKYEILDGLKSLLADVPMIEITVFDEDLAENVFQSWLKRDRRCLTSLQMSWLQPKLQSRKFIIIRTSAGNWSGKFEEYDLPSNDFTSLKTHPEYSIFIDEETGITIYCVLENGELRQYNVTIMTYLPYERTNQSENSLLKEPIDSLQIQNKFVVTLDTRKW
ncbi:unnamed protein product [Rotaria sordida]|uniref:Uncharacterized protein n=1 Tax=Rotaria sordida TaxID=392033 RepID=A0A814V6U7_9BILA|nr:unnamed protein product [Rotaria sordida]